MHIVWINEAAQSEGPAETRLLAWLKELEGQGVTSTLLYGVPGWTEPKFTSRFEQAFPLVDLNLQLREIGPDLVWVNRPTGLPWPQGDVETDSPLVWCCHNRPETGPGNLRPTAWVVFSGEAAGQLIGQGIEREKIHVLNPDSPAGLLDLVKTLV